MSRTSLKECDGIRLKNFIIAGAKWVYHHKDHLDEINYFPVPDADTGANMYLTFTSILNEIRKVENPYLTSSIARAAALGGLMGSKGNSGLILSQFFRGFSESIGDKEVLDAEDIANAFYRAAQTAREGILSPKDGTILSVAYDGANAALASISKSEDLIEVMTSFYDGACESLEKTKTLLPELRKAGVVDAGGKGLVLFFEGMLRLATARSVKDVPVIDSQEIPDKAKAGKTITHQFCTTFIIQKNLDIDDNHIKKIIKSYGDSVIVDKGIDNFAKIYIHTNNPDQVLEKASELGKITNVMIDDMKKQIVNL